MQGNRLHIVNIALMAISAIAAIRFPFETLLLAYGILGPLHYLTEISWLRDRSYFLSSRADILPILYAGLVLVFGSAFLSKENYSAYFPTIYALVLLTVFFLAFVLPLTRNRIYRTCAAVTFAALSWEMERHLTLTTSLVAFLPTIVHVYVFTGIFMFSGCIKSASRFGNAALVFFCLLPALCWLVPAGWTHVVTPWAGRVYGDTFGQINILILGNLGIHIDASDIVLSASSILVTRFLAFSYLYHYLNWFSKTKTIGWATMSRERSAFIVACWIASVALYAWNFPLGFQVLFALSFLHVLLEFPLDHIVIRQIFSVALNRVIKQ